MMVVVEGVNVHPPAYRDDDLSSEMNHCTHSPSTACCCWLSSSSCRAQRSPQRQSRWVKDLAMGKASEGGFYVCSRGKDDHSPVEMNE